MHACYAAVLWCVEWPRDGTRSVARAFNECGDYTNRFLTLLLALTLPLPLRRILFHSDISGLLLHYVFISYVTLQSTVLYCLVKMYHGQSSLTNLLRFNTNTFWSSETTMFGHNLICSSSSHCREGGGELWWGEGEGGIGVGGGIFDWQRSDAIPSSNPGGDRAPGHGNFE